MVIAFLNSGIDVTVYMQLSIKYYADPNNIALLLKMLYRLKQSTCQWASLLDVALKEVGLKPFYSDSFIYVFNPKTTKMLIVAIYVYDILINRLDMDKINLFKRWPLDQATFLKSGYQIIFEKKI